MGLKDTTDSRPQQLPSMPVIPAPERVTTITPEEIRHANRPSTQMALALAAKGGHTYEGTVDPAVKARRRAKNRAARKARRAAR